jgi:hypothetical protein
LIIFLKTFIKRNGKVETTKDAKASTFWPLPAIATKLKATANSTLQ